MVDVEWVPHALTSELAASAPLTDINALTAEYLRRLVVKMPDVRATYVPSDQEIWSSTPRAYNVHFDVSPEIMAQGVHPEHFLEPAAEVTARKLREHQWLAFGAMPVDVGGPDVEAAAAVDERTGIAVRGLRVFNEDAPYFTHPRWMVRFDVLGRPA